MRLLSLKHIEPCPICRMPSVRCFGHEPELWAIQDQLDRVHADIKDNEAPGKIKIEIRGIEHVRQAFMNLDARIAARIKETMEAKTADLLRGGRPFQ